MFHPYGWLFPDHFEETGFVKGKGANEYSNILVARGNSIPGRKRSHLSFSAEDGIEYVYADFANNAI